MNAATRLTQVNAVGAGILSKFTLLPWESEEEYQALLAAVMDEHTPRGPTETHPVTELAGFLWRKRRLRLAENSTYQRQLNRSGDSSTSVEAALVMIDLANCRVVDVGRALRAGNTKQDDVLSDLAADKQMTLTAIDLLKADGEHAYENALKALHESTRTSWRDRLTWEPDDEDEEPYCADASGLLRYLRNEILPWYDDREDEIVAQPHVRNQALGEALDPDRLERLGRYEVHLDRKFERTLSALIRLKQMREAAAGAEKIRFAKIAFGRTGAGRIRTGQAMTRLQLRAKPSWRFDAANVRVAIVLRKMHAFELVEFDKDGVVNCTGFAVDLGAVARSIDQVGRVPSATDDRRLALSESVCAVCRCGHWDSRV